MAFNSKSKKPYIKSLLELQREITLIELAPSPYFFVLNICLAYMNMFARFDGNPAMTLWVIKETKRYNVKTVYPPQTKFAGSIMTASENVYLTLAHIVDPDQTAPTGAVWSGSKLFIYEASNSLVDDKKNIHFVIMRFKG